MSDIKQLEIERKHQHTITSMQKEFKQAKQEAKKHYDDLKKEFKQAKQEAKQRHNEVKQNNDELKQQYQSLQTTNRSILEDLSGISIKNIKIVEALSKLRLSIDSLPICKIEPIHRIFDPILRISDDRLQSILAIHQITIYQKHTRYIHYIVNHAQDRSIKKCIRKSYDRIINNYNDNIEHEINPLFFTVSSYAIQTWNILKSRAIIQMNGSEINLEPGLSIKAIITEIESISLKPEEELKIIQDEYIRLQTVEGDEKEFLAEFQRSE